MAANDGHLIVLTVNDGQWSVERGGKRSLHSSVHWAEFKFECIEFDEPMCPLKTAGRGISSGSPGSPEHPGGDRYLGSPMEPCSELCVQFYEAARMAN